MNHGNKDFIVKNGLTVQGGGKFDTDITVAGDTVATHTYVADQIATKDNTDEVTEGTTNLYYTTARADSDFDIRIATKSTYDVAEGDNLYYTQ